jgi:hypothetical protein
MQLKVLNVDIVTDFIYFVALYVISNIRILSQGTAHISNKNI